MRSWRLPALATSSPRVSDRFSGGKIAVRKALRSVEYSTRPSAQAKSGRRSRRKPSKAGSSRAVRSEEHTSELQSLMRNSYAGFCVKKKIKKATHDSYYHTHIIQSAQTVNRKESM